MAKMNVMTLNNLALYDELLKGYISEQDALALKTVAIDGNTLKFYKVAEPVGDTAPAYEITLPETDISGLIPKITSATKGNVVIANADGTVADGGVALSALATKEEVNDLDGRLDVVEPAIEAINNADTGILAKAKEYADGKDAAIAAAQKAGDDAAAAATQAQSEVDALEKVVTDLDTYVGEIPEGYTEETVIAYVNKKAEETLNAASGGSSESAASVLAALNTYKAENDPKVAANEAAAAAAQSAADDAQADVDALAEKVGEVTEGKTVVQMIADAQSAATYDDTKVKEDIQANADAIAEEKARMDAFMKLEDGQTLNDALDSLKELQDYITNEAADADVVVGKVAALEAIVDGIGGEGEEATVVAYVTKAIEAIGIGDYAKAADLTAAVERIVALEGKMTTVEGKVSTLESEMDAVEAKASANETAISGVDGRVTTAEGKVSTLESEMDTVEGKVSALEGLVGEGYAEIAEQDIRNLFA